MKLLSTFVLLFVVGRLICMLFAIIFKYCFMYVMGSWSAVCIGRKAYALLFISCIIWLTFILRAHVLFFEFAGSFQESGAPS